MRTFAWCGSGWISGGKYETGKKILGLEEAGRVEGCQSFSRRNHNSADGGLCKQQADGFGPWKRGGQELRRPATEGVEAVRQIGFEGMHYRKDIGARAINTDGPMEQTNWCRLLMGSDSDFGNSCARLVRRWTKLAWLMRRGKCTSAHRCRIEPPTCSKGRHTRDFA